METLAFVHLTAAYENPESVKFDFKGFEALNCKKLPSSAWIHLGAIALSLIILSTANVSFAAGTTLLQRGSRGAQVTALQQSLTRAGVYNGPVTGFYGSLTQASVRRFQQARGLAVDGIAGPNTLAALGTTNAGNPGNTLPTNVLLRRGSSGPAVTQLQRTLANRGYFNGPITGYYGRITESAVRRYQQANGLVADGVAGRNTLLALGGRNGNTPPIASTRLERGSAGPAVSQLQDRLRVIGFYNGPTTGEYGALTEAAVRDFQSSRGISVNGIAGPTTLAALQRGSTGGSGAIAVSTPTRQIVPLQPGNRGPRVRSLQARLGRLGYYTGPIDGVFGPDTEAALRSYQQDSNLIANGIADANTFASLSPSA